MKLFWTTVFILSMIIFLALGLPFAKIYIGLDVPFVSIANNIITVFGYDFVGYEEQLGLMFLCPMLMMLPGRTMHLALLKLFK